MISIARLISNSVAYNCNCRNYFNTLSEGHINLLILPLSRVKSGAAPSVLYFAPPPTYKVVSIYLIRTSSIPLEHLLLRCSAWNFCSLPVSDKKDTKHAMWDAAVTAPITLNDRPYNNKYLVIFCKSGVCQTRGLFTCSMWKIYGGRGACDGHRGYKLC